jgi:hypothetical protein
VRATVATIAALTLLAGASTVHAAQRYAAPAGSGGACTQAQPCSVEAAVGGAESFDEVIVTQGAYTLKEPLIPFFGVTDLYVHGDFAGPRPAITAEFKGGAINLENARSRLAYVEVTNTSSTPYGAFCAAGGTVERVRLTARGPFGRGLSQGYDCAVRDSVLIAEGTESTALYSLGFQGTQTAVARNVTAIAHGMDSVGVRSRYEGVPASHLLDARNVIASGEGADVRTVNNSNGPGNLVITNSNFDTPKADPGTTIDAGSNQTAPPLFVNAALGDYREAAGSPTIDAGSTDAQIGTLDFDGSPRSLGLAPDIGAYELVPPAGEIRSLALAPKRFRPLNAGGAIFSAKKKSKAPLGTTVSYSLSGKAQVEFFVERRVPGRRVRGKCRKVTKANRRKKRCATFRLIRTGFAAAGVAGQNGFRFSGRIGGKALKRGSYRLVAGTRSTTLRAPFRIVR